jgi:hypothetical protein
MDDENGSTGSGFFGNPNLLPLLGLIAGAGQSAAPSRLPVTKGMVFGSLAQGLANGIGAEQEARLRAAQIGAMQNRMLGINVLRRQRGLPPLGMGNPGGDPGGFGAPFGVPGTGSGSVPGWPNPRGSGSPFLQNM